MSQDKNNIQIITKRGEKAYRASIFVSDGHEFRKGYLWKKATHGILPSGFRAYWQKRYFVVKNHYICYYKNDHSRKLLAAIDMRQVERIDSVAGNIFSVGLGDSRSFQLKAINGTEALTWVEYLRKRREICISERDAILRLDEKTANNNMNGSTINDFRRSVSIINSLLHPAVKNGKKNMKPKVEYGDDDEEEELLLQNYSHLQLWELISGNLNAQELTPSPARDRVRLAIATSNMIQENSHVEATILINDKEKVTEAVNDMEDDMKPSDVYQLDSEGRRLSLRALLTRGSSKHLVVAEGDYEYDDKPDGITNEIWEAVKKEGDTSSEGGNYKELVDQANLVNSILKKQTINSKFMNNISYSSNRSINNDSPDNNKALQTAIAPTATNKDSIWEAAAAVGKFRSAAAMKTTKTNMNIEPPLSVYDRKAFELERHIVKNNIRSNQMKLLDELKWIDFIFENRLSTSTNPYEKCFSLWQSEKIDKQNMLHSIQIESKALQKEVEQLANNEAETRKRLINILGTIHLSGKDGGDSEEWDLFKYNVSEILSLSQNTVVYKQDWSNNVSSFMSFWMEQHNIWNVDRTVYQKELELAKMREEAVASDSCSSSSLVTNDLVTSISKQKNASSGNTSNSSKPGIVVADQEEDEQVQTRSHPVIERIEEVKESNRVNDVILSDLCVEVEYLNKKLKEVTDIINYKKSRINSTLFANK